MVDLQWMTCTCKKFDLKNLLCEHALRAAGEIGKNKFYNCCYLYYSVDYWMLVYKEFVHPIPSQPDWEILDEIQEVVVLPSNLKEQCKTRRPGNNKYRSSSELPKRKNKCTNCG